MTLRAPFRVSSIWVRDNPGLRVWTLESRRHCSVATRLPRPLTSMAPPQGSESKVPARQLGNRGRPSAFRGELGHLVVLLPVGNSPHALKPKRAMATSVFGFRRRTKIGPSAANYQPRSVGKGRKST